jgi:hypothetical protein
MLGLLIALITAPADRAPLPPIGTHAHFQGLAKETAELLEAKKFTQAAERATNLPKPKFSITIKPQGISKDQLQVVNQAARQAASEWKRVVPELEITLAPKGELLIEPVNRIAAPGDDETNKTLVTFESADPKEPALEAVLALRRSAKDIHLDSGTIAAEIGYAIGRYLGIERSPRPGTIMFRVDGLSTRPPTVDLTAAKVASAALKVAQTLRQAAKSKAQLLAQFPEFFLGTKEIDYGKIQQGDTRQFQVEVVNRGKAPLKFNIVPDCSCFVLDFKPEVPPESSQIVTIYMSSIEFQGPQNKGIYFYTDDPTNPVSKLTVIGFNNPAYRVVFDQTPALYQMPENGLAFKAWIYAENGLPFEPRKVSVNGVSASASIKPYEGPISDPQWLASGSVQKGYEISVLVSPTAVKGRVLAALMIQTDSKVFPVVAQNFQVQRGLAINPQNVYFGDVTDEVAQAAVILQGLENLTVTNLKIADQRFKARAEAVGIGTVRLIVEFRPTKEKGTIQTTLTADTNDPESPKLSIPIQAYVP